MKKGILTVFCLFVIRFLTAQTTLEITEKVADNVLQNTSFRLIDKKSGEKFSSTINLSYNQSVSVESASNEWYYMNGVINIGMLKLAEQTHNRKYSDYTLRNFDFIFSNLPFFKKQYDEKVPESSFLQFFRPGKPDDCGAMSVALNDLHGLGAVILADTEMNLKVLLFQERIRNFIMQLQLSMGISLKSTVKKSLNRLL